MRTRRILMLVGIAITLSPSVGLVQSSTSDQTARGEWRVLTPPVGDGLGVGTALAGEQTKVRPSVATDTGFGYRVAISGDTAVVGLQSAVFSVPENEPIGSGGGAYVFTRNGAGTWSFQARLLPLDGVERKTFGESVAISGNTILVGAYSDSTVVNRAGSAYVFVGSGSTWVQQAKLVASDPGAIDEFGWSVAIDGNTVVIGAPGDDYPGVTNAGSAYVFTGAGSSWTQRTKLAATPLQGTGFGYDVAIKDGTVAVAGTNGGYAFVGGGSTWSQQARLVPSGPALPAQAIAVHTDTIVVGAPTATVGSAARQGAAFVFARAGGVWSEQARLVASDGAATDEFGYDVAVSGNTVLVGAYSDSLVQPKMEEGSAYVFSRNGTTWTETQKVVASDAGSGEKADFSDFFFEWFGRSVALDGTSAIVGAPSDTSENGVLAAQGSAYMFTVTGELPSDAPRNLRGTVIGSAVTLAWDPPTSGAAPSAYVVDAGTTAGASNIGSFNVGAVTSITFPTVPNGSYFVRVRAVRGAGLSTPSNEVTLTVPGLCRRALPPTNVVVSVAGSEVTLTWEPVAGASRYLIDVGSASDTTDLMTITAPPSPTHFSAVAPPGVFFVRVRAVTMCGPTSPSRERWIRVGGTGPTSLAVNDTATTPWDEEAVIPVLANDRVSLGGRLSIVAVTQPTNGSADVNPDGTITYAPVDEFVGTETFTYTVEDERGAFDTGTVAVNVTTPSPESLQAALETAPIVKRVTERTCYWVDPDFQTQVRMGGRAFQQEIGPSGVTQFRMNFKVYKPDHLKFGADFETGGIPSGTFANDAQSYYWEQGGAVTWYAGYNYKIMVKLTWVRPGRRDYNRTLYVGQCDAR